MGLSRRRGFYYWAEYKPCPEAAPTRSCRSNILAWESEAISFTGTPWVEPAGGMHIAGAPIGSGDV